MHTPMQTHMMHTLTNRCGSRGSDVVVLQYDAHVHPEEVVITAWLPDSCRLRVLALHPPGTHAVRHPASCARSEETRVYTTAGRRGGGGDAVVVMPAVAGARGGGGATAGSGAETSGVCVCVYNKGTCVI